MPRFFKTLLLLLMIAALPVQGMAAIMQMSCGGAHHEAAQAMQRDAALLADAHDHHAMAHAAHHGDDGHAAHQLAADTGHPDHSHHSQQSQQAHGSCSACAACCTGAVAPPSAFVPPVERIGSQAVIVSLPALAIGGMPTALDRPPKRFPA